MTLNDSPLSPTDLRVLSGVDERKNLKLAMLITNLGNSTIRILEAGYQDFDMPAYAYSSAQEKSNILSPGEQVLLQMPDLLKINHQLTNNIKMGENGDAKIFVVTTKGKRFEAPAIIEVAE